MAAMFARFSNFYGRSFDRHPWLTLAVTNGGLSALADGCAQGFELYEARRQSPGVPPNGEQERSALQPSLVPSRPDSRPSSEPVSNHPLTCPSTPGFDLLRSARFLGFGVVMAPPLDVWNKLLETRFPVVQGGRVRLSLLLRRVVVDQGFFAPISVAAFIGIISVFEGQSRAEIVEKYHNMYSEALLANWKIWPLVQLINFRFMPLKYRVPFVSSCGVFWTIYLSLLNMSKSNKMTEPDLAAAIVHA